MLFDIFIFSFFTIVHCHPSDPIWRNIVTYDENAILVSLMSLYACAPQDHNTLKKIFPFLFFRDESKATFLRKSDTV